MNFLNGLFQRKSSLSRKKKQEVFFNLMKPYHKDTLLDVGGNLGLGFEEIRKYFKKCYVVDIDENSMKAIEGSGVIPIVADACQLPFKDNSIIFCVF
jgi:ubiquinone/menaquinone biosynthesis C-methylase UbiE